MASGNTTASSDKQIRARRTQHRFGYLVFGDEIVDVTTFTNIPASYKGLPHVPEFDENDPVRLLMQSVNYYVAHKDEATEPLFDFGDPACKWKRQDQAAATSFSALGLFFARSLSEKLGVPVGAICVAANGAQIQELMPGELAESFKLRTSYGAGVAHIFNGMMNPLIGLSFKGMVFFQGESEALSESVANKYSKYLRAYIEDLRKRTGIMFPLCNIQLSSYGDHDSKTFKFIHNVRNQQFDAYRLIPDSILVTSYDLRSPDKYGDQMHSPRKQELGERVCDAVLAAFYGVGDTETALCPEPVSAKLSDDGSTVTVKFKNVAGGLTSTGEDGSVNGFSIGSKTKKVNAEAKIVSADTVTVKIPDGVKATFITYGNYLVIKDGLVSLCGGTGLPALAFCISVE